MQSTSHPLARWRCWNGQIFHLCQWTGYFKVKELKLSDGISYLGLKTWTWRQFIQRLCHTSCLINLMAMILFLYVIKAKKNIFHAFYSTLASQTLVLNKIYSEECDHLNYSLYSISLYLKCFATSFVFSKYEHISQLMTFKKMCSLWK